ncbi:2-keto-3-deoxygluconate permease [Alkalibacterium sp. MB6]|uniref:2-keto-3-deoxygluconate permease n=1 Tax=Alkalibacterium sp. MB6 TaxID=2081965 RepID=UPI001379449F|nr:2-keto-3-deoxygluconate permease [Alkalibacterium sp. MB6]
MLAKINKIPAGTFLVPLILSIVVYTIWPNLFMIGGMTQALFSGEGVGVITAILTFISGTAVDVKQTGRLLKRQGVLFIVKALFSLALSWIFLQLFGQHGVLGISSLAFVAVITSSNTAIYLLTARQYGDEIDTGAFGFFGILSLPLLPTFIYSFVFASGGNVDWTPVLSILIPLILGIIVGNIDRGFYKLFGPAIGGLLPILGWNLGQGLNIIEAVRAGIPGLILTLIYIIASSILVITDRMVLKNDGLYGLSLVTVAGLTTSVPALIAHSYPPLQPYVSAATAQILFAVIITCVGAPIVIAKWNDHMIKTGEKPLKAPTSDEGIN